MVNKARGVAFMVIFSQDSTRSALGLVAAASASAAGASRVGLRLLSVLSFAWLRSLLNNTNLCKNLCGGERNCTCSVHDKYEPFYWLGFRSMTSTFLLLVLERARHARVRRSVSS